MHKIKYFKYFIVHECFKLFEYNENIMNYEFSKKFQYKCKNNLIFIVVYSTDRQYSTDVYVGQYMPIDN